MDDFRVGSVPSPEPYGDRHPYGLGDRKRQRHREESGQQEEEPADSFEAASAEEELAATDEDGVKDYYLPSEPAAEDE